MEKKPKKKSNVKSKSRAKEAVSKQNIDSSTVKKVTPLQQPLLTRAQEDKLRRD